MGGMGLDTAKRCRRGFVRERCCGSRRWRVGLDTVERCRRGFVRERCCGSRGWRVSLGTAKRCRREFVGEIGGIKRKMGCILRGQMIIYNEIYRKECFRA